MPPPKHFQPGSLGGSISIQILSITSLFLLSHGIQLFLPRTGTHFISLISICNLVLTPKPNAPRLSPRIRTTEPHGPCPGLPKSHPTGQIGRYERERGKNKGHVRTKTRKQIWRFRHRGCTSVFIDTKKPLTRGLTHKT